jgi:hypothetical protein
MKPLLFLLLCASVSPWFAPPALAQSPDHTPLDTLLQATVKDELIDYATIKQKHLPALTAYLDTLARTDVANLDRPTQLAYYINLYNASMIKTICDRLKPGYTVAEFDHKVFKEPLVRTIGKTISLNDLEHNIIRPTFKDPRIHVALVCGARSCPPILPRAYKPEDLDATLDRNMKAFLADRTRNPIDPQTRTLKLSQIFNWYPEDFGGKPNLPAYVARYTGADYTGWKLEFTDYSWALNDARMEDRR